MTERAWLAVVLLATHFFFSNQYPGWINPNEQSRFYTTLALVEDGTFAIDGPLARYGDTQDKARYQGRYYSDKAPGYSLALVPLAWLLRAIVIPESEPWALLLALRLLGLSLPIVAFWLFARGFFLRVTGRPQLASAVVLCGALGTPFFVYATQLFSASAAGALLFVAWRWLAVDPDRAPRALVAGLVAGLAFTFDFVVMPAVAVLALDAALGRSRPAARFAGFAAGTGSVLLLWMAHNVACFDHPLRVGFHLHADPRYGAAYAAGLLGIQRPTAEAAWGLVLSPSRGLFFLSPALLLAFFGGWRLWRQGVFRREVVVCAAIAASVFAFATTTVEWQGGWAVGPRYLVPAIPFLLVGVAGALRGASTALAVAFSSASFVGILGIAVAAASFPAFPDVFEDPLHHFALPLLARGFHGESLLLPGRLQLLAVPAYLALSLGAAVSLSSAALAGSAHRFSWVLASCAVGLAVWCAPGPLLREPDATRQDRAAAMEFVLRVAGAGPVASS